MRTPNRNRFRRPLAFTIGLAMSVVALHGSRAAETPGLRERQIRAALVYKLARFVTWPEKAFAAGRQFDLCFTGDELTARALSGIEARLIQNRRARLRRIAEPDARAIAQCNLLYLAAPVAIPPEALDAAVGAAVLTVADGPLTQRGLAMVELLPRDNRVSLAIDLGMVRAARLRVDAPLLQLVEVRP
jgi:hypothetical protein